MDATSSAIASSLKTVRGCFGFGEIESIETSFCCATSLPPTVSEVGINASKFVPNPPRFALMQFHRFVLTCN